MLIEVSERCIFEIIKLKALESGRMGNFDKIEPAINRIRYRIFDLILSETVKWITLNEKL